MQGEEDTTTRSKVKLTLQECNTKQLSPHPPPLSAVGFIQLNTGVTKDILRCQCLQGRFNTRRVSPVTSEKKKGPWALLSVINIFVNTKTFRLDWPVRQASLTEGHRCRWCLSSLIFTPSHSPNLISEALSLVSRLALWRCASTVSAVFLTGYVVSYRQSNMPWLYLNSQRVMIHKYRLVYWEDRVIV